MENTNMGDIFIQLKKLGELMEEDIHILKDSLKGELMDSYERSVKNDIESIEEIKKELEQLNVFKTL